MRGFGVKLGSLRRGLLIAIVAVVGFGSGASASAATTYSAGSVREISRCPGQNAEVQSAVDPSGRYVYEEWIGCDGIGFARSTDGGAQFDKASRLRGSGPEAWDPTVAVGRHGTVYAAFMVMRGSRAVPVVVASFDRGRSFAQETVLSSPARANWGDRPFIAVGPDGTVYLTWDYGPSQSQVKVVCPPGGSCGFTAGDLNTVLQVSTDRAKSFGPMMHVTPGYPAGGAASAPLVVEPSGRIDVLYEGFAVKRGKNPVLGTGRTYFTSSADGGRTWTTPGAIGASAGTMSPRDWWIDGDISLDSAGNLYATWDTHGRYHDIGWLSYSTDHGVHWSPPLRVSPDARRVPHIVEVAGGPPGVAYVGWLTNRRPWGYAQYLRIFSITRGWLSGPEQISRQFGAPSVWPGDTFGISPLPANSVVLSWGSAVPGARGESEIFAARVAVAVPGPR